MELHPVDLVVDRSCRKTIAAVDVRVRVDSEVDVV
jgi:hypothetical protein